ncbi:zinc ribbon domain-containing protein [uncultured Dysosmobacter sp.]|uniref:zinc ribbon domain-containing protein n=1 Tax=uncultured Dysosmobacter sp. TaxID=2591384 RepID=UPI00262A6561|nr:zinc ribbon domain-containing protein [uncultured Dysosmobacter sp.]
MKSVKPGRGPSAMGALGSVIAVIFGIFWTISAVSMGAPGFFPLFGVLFIILGVVQVVYNLKNATGEHRYSAFDIVEDGEEPDPLDRRSGPQEDGEAPADGGFRFCPYCGARLGEDFDFCGKCGRKLPEEQ